MLIGHYGAAYALRAYDRSLPLWVYCLLVQAVDIVFFVFAVVGIEELEILPHDGPLALGLVSVPYTHSLLLNGVYAAALLGIGLLIRRPRVGMLMAIASLSHWATDLIVHVHDLPATTAQNHRFGFALWDYPEFGLALELTVLLAGGFLLWRTVDSARGRHAVVVSLVVLSVVQTAYVLLPPFRPVALMAFMAELIYVSVAVLAWSIDRAVSDGSRDEAQRRRATSVASPSSSTERRMSTSRLRNAQTRSPGGAWNGPGSPTSPTADRTVMTKTPPGANM